MLRRIAAGLLVANLGFCALAPGGSDTDAVAAEHLRRQVAPESMRILSEAESAAAAAAPSAASAAASGSAAR